MRRAFLLLLLTLPLGAAAPPDRILHTETLSGTFMGWERGDYLWARIAVPGRGTISAMPGPTPIGQFLEANRGRRVTVEIRTVLTTLPEAGETDIRRIVRARNNLGTADVWWRRLNIVQRRAAQRRYEGAID